MINGYQTTNIMSSSRVGMGNSTELVTPPAGSKIGERVVCEGFEQEPDEVCLPPFQVNVLCMDLWVCVFALLPAQ